LTGARHAYALTAARRAAAAGLARSRAQPLGANGAGTRSAKQNREGEPGTTACALLRRPSANLAKGAR